MPTQGQFTTRTRAATKANGSRTRKSAFRNPNPPPPPNIHPLKRKKSPPKRLSTTIEGIPPSTYPVCLKSAPFPSPTTRELCQHPKQTNVVTTPPLPTHEPNKLSKPAPPTSVLMPPPRPPSGLRIRIKNQPKISLRQPESSPSSPISQPESSDLHPFTQPSNRTTRSQANQQETDLLSLLNGLKAHKKQNKCKTDVALAPGCLSHTKKYEWLIAEVVDDFLDALASVEDSKWSSMLELVPHEGLTGSTHAPKILVFVGGIKSTLKCQIANKALIDWQAVTSKKSPKKYCAYSWYQPVTQNQRLRTFFSTVDKKFDWQYQINDFTFKGGVKGFLATLYLKRLKNYGKVSINLFNRCYF